MPDRDCSFESVESIIMDTLYSVKEIEGELKKVQKSDCLIINGSQQGNKEPKKVIIELF